MNENINLVNILRDCPIGTELYSSVFGKVTFLCIDNLNSVYPIKVKVGFRTNQSKQFTKRGTYFSGVGECILFPSEDQRDWNKFTAPWYIKKDKFNPNTLKPFDKILVRDNANGKWVCTLFSHINNDTHFICQASDSAYIYSIPYNGETKHLVGTTEEAPEYYRYWEI